MTWFDVDGILIERLFRQAPRIWYTTQKLIADFLLQEQSMTQFKQMCVKKAATVVALCATVLLASCGGGGGGGGGGGNSGGDASLGQIAGPSTTPGQFWERAAPIYDVCCNYAQLIIDSANPEAHTQIYTNSDPSGNGIGLHLYDGTLAGVSYKGEVFTTNSPRDSYIRTFGMAKRNGKYYALLYTGDGYPTAGGYSPSWATSDDGVLWRWSGPVSPYPRALSSGQALTAEPDGSFKAWIDDVGGTLREMSSPNGLKWTDNGDIWPASLPKGQAVFPNATRTPNGTMLAVANAFPATKIRTLWRCHNQSVWSVLEEDAPIRNGDKGVALAWDGSKIHAYANGARWTRAEPVCPAR